jgi:hypothetical protein
MKNITIRDIAQLELMSGEVMPYGIDEESLSPFVSLLKDPRIDVVIWALGIMAASSLFPAFDGSEFVKYMAKKLVPNSGLGRDQKSLLTAAFKEGADKSTIEAAVDMIEWYMVQNHAVEWQLAVLDVLLIRGNSKLSQLHTLLNEAGYCEHSELSDVMQCIQTQTFTKMLKQLYK